MGDRETRRQGDSETLMPAPAWNRQRLILIRVAALAGMIGPILLGGVIVVLTVLEYDFLLSLRWHPLYATTIDWPSGLALGPYGWSMVSAFILSGLLLACFAVGLHWQLTNADKLSWAPRLLFVAAVAMMLLGFKTDPTYRTTPHTVHGLIHDAAFVLLGLTLLPALFLLALRFQRDPVWQPYARYTLITVLVIAPAFALKGIAFYLFLAGVLLWFEIIAVRLWQLTRTH